MKNYGSLTGCHPPSRTLQMRECGGVRILVEEGLSPDPTFATMTPALQTATELVDEIIAVILRPFADRPIQFAWAGRDVGGWHSDGVVHINVNPAAGYVSRIRMYELVCHEFAHSVCGVHDSSFASSMWLLGQHNPEGAAKYLAVKD